MESCSCEYIISWIQYQNSACFYSNLLNDSKHNDRQKDAHKIWQYTYLMASLNFFLNHEYALSWTLRNASQANWQLKLRLYSQPVEWFVWVSLTLQIEAINIGEHTTTKIWIFGWITRCTKNSNEWTLGKQANRQTDALWLRKQVEWTSYKIKNHLNITNVRLTMTMSVCVCVKQTKKNVYQTINWRVDRFEVKFYIHICLLWGFFFWRIQIYVKQWQSPNHPNDIQFVVQHFAITWPWWNAHLYK